mgnify:CR=1 FL=1
MATADGNLYSHENGNDDGQRAGAAPVAITSFIQSADMAVGDGEEFVLTKRVIPDVNFIDSDTASFSGGTLTPEVQMTVGVRNFPGVASSTSDVEGTSLQRNIGLNKVKKNSNYVMFLDDDVQFEKKSFKIMRNYLGTSNAFDSSFDTEERKIAPLLSW